MLRVSNYNIYLNTLDDENKYLFMHGYTGAVDLISKDIYQCFIRAEDNPGCLNDLSSETLSVLKSRGYVTERTAEEEKKLLQNAAYSIREHNQSTPVISIIPTYNCNFRCGYCYEAKLKKNGKQWMEKVISKNTIDTVFYRIKMLNNENKSVNSIILYGGEPLLEQNYETIEYIVKNCIEYHIELKCVTNGYDLERFQGLIGQGKIEFLQITLDGLMEMHNKRRFLAEGKPTFEVIANNIDLALKLGAAVSVRTNIDEGNVDQLGGLLEFYRQKGWMENKMFYPHFKSVENCSGSDEKDVDEQYIIKSLRQFGSNKLNYDSSYTMLANSFMHLFKNKKFAPYKGGFCGAVNGHMVIDPYGDIYPCWAIVGNKEFATGSIYYDGNLNSQHDTQYWDNKIETYIDQCSDCQYALFCGGGCPIYINNKTKSKPDYCSKFKKMFHEVVPEVYRTYITEMSLF